MIAHVVLFRPKDTVTGEERHAFAQALERACRDSPTVRRARVGRAIDVGVTYLGGGSIYSYAAVLEFDDREGLLAYLRHPAHLMLSDVFWQTCESTLILDVEMAVVVVHPISSILV